MKLCAHSSACKALRHHNAVVHGTIMDSYFLFPETYTHATCSHANRCITATYVRNGPSYADCKSQICPRKQLRFGWLRRLYAGQVKVIRHHSERTVCHVVPCLLGGCVPTRQVIHEAQVEQEALLQDNRQRRSGHWQTSSKTCRLRRVCSTSLCSSRPALFAATCAWLCCVFTNCTTCKLMQSVLTKLQDADKMQRHACHATKLQL